MSGQAPVRPTQVRPVDEDSLAEAVSLLRAGEAVAVPTETVYGLAADAARGEAVARIYAAKRRPSFNPLIVHVAGLAMAEPLVRLPARARDLAERFWPGPLTLVLERRRDAPIASLVTAGLPTLAVRAPDHPAMQMLLALFGGGLAAPSANRSGALTPTTAAHVLASLEGEVPLILDAGPCRLGIESTIVAVAGDRVRLLRPGAIPVEALGVEVEPAPKAGSIEAPGQLASHYAPTQPVRLNARKAQPGEYLIGFGAIAGHGCLSEQGDLVEAAARLFDMLHLAQASGAARIAVAPIPAHGLGRAINDRLKRAAAPRSTPTPE